MYVNPCMSTTCFRFVLLTTPSNFIMSLLCLVMTMFAMLCNVLIVLLMILLIIINRVRAGILEHSEHRDRNYRNTKLAFPVPPKPVQTSFRIAILYSSLHEVCSGILITPVVFPPGVAPHNYFYSRHTVIFFILFIVG